MSTVILPLFVYVMISGRANGQLIFRLTLLAKNLLLAQLVGSYICYSHWNITAFQLQRSPGWVGNNVFADMGGGVLRTTISTTRKEGCLISNQGVGAIAGNKDVASPHNDHCGKKENCKKSRKGINCRLNLGITNWRLTDPTKHGVWMPMAGMVVQDWLSGSQTAAFIGKRPEAPKSNAALERNLCERWKSHCTFWVQISRRCKYMTKLGIIKCRVADSS